MSAPGPLAGRTVVVTRALDQAGELVTRLEAAGARVLTVPTIAVEPVTSPSLENAARHLDRYRWVVWTSVNGVDATLAARRPTDPAPRRVAVVGKATAARVRAAGLPVDLVPDHHTGAGLAAAFPAFLAGPSDPPAYGGTDDRHATVGPGAAPTPAAPDGSEAPNTDTDSGGNQVLVAHGDRAAPTVVDGLRAKGWAVDAVVAYRTVHLPVPPDLAAAAAAADAVTFTSGSTVTGYVAAGLAPPAAVVTIGPVTSADCRAAGLAVAAQAAQATVDGLVHAVVRALARP